MRHRSARARPDVIASGVVVLAALGLGLLAAPLALVTGWPEVARRQMRGVLSLPRHQTVPWALRASMLRSQVGIGELPGAWPPREAAQCWSSGGCVDAACADAVGGDRERCDARLVERMYMWLAASGVRVHSVGSLAERAPSPPIWIADAPGPVLVRGRVPEPPWPLWHPHTMVALTSDGRDPTSLSVLALLAESATHDDFLSALRRHGYRVACETAALAKEERLQAGIAALTEALAAVDPAVAGDHANHGLIGLGLYNVPARHDHVTSLGASGPPTMWLGVRVAIDELAWRLAVLRIDRTPRHVVHELMLGKTFLGFVVSGGGPLLAGGQPLPRPWPSLTDAQLTLLRESLAQSASHAALLDKLAARGIALDPVTIHDN